jgi:hypothetical protein
MQTAWDMTQVAKEYDPLPRGKYTARLDSGELFKHRTGTPGYKLTFSVLEGEHAGRKIWHDLWLTPKAMPYTNRDLNKIGITAIEQLEKPLPQSYVCEVTVVLRKDDYEIERNQVKGFKVLRVEELPVDPFAPKDDVK